jgi:hypothetical protein
MGMTLAEARTKVREDYLDDDGTRWSDAQIDRALESAISETYFEYISNGGTRFQEVLVLTSSSGEVDLSSYDPAYIHSVSLVVGDRAYSIMASEIGSRTYNDTSNRTYEIVLSPTPEMPDADDEPLLKRTIDDTGLRTWAAFEDLVCVRAALNAGIKDGRPIHVLQTKEARLLPTVMIRPRNPRTRRFPDQIGNFWASQLRWHFDPDDLAIMVHKRLTTG